MSKKCDQCWLDFISRLIIILGNCRFDFFYLSPTFKVSVLLGVHVLKTVNSVSCFGTLIVQKCRKFFQGMLFSILTFMFLYNYWLDFFFQNLIWKFFFTLAGIFGRKIIDFVPFSGMFWDQKCEKVLLVLIYLDNQTYVFFSTLLVSFFR